MRKILLAAIAIVIAEAGTAFSQQPKSQKQKPATQANNAPSGAMGRAAAEFQSRVKGLSDSGRRAATTAGAARSAKGILLFWWTMASSTRCTAMASVK
jgi:hypothetical protein